MVIGVIFTNGRELSTFLTAPTSKLTTVARRKLVVDATILLQAVQGEELPEFVKLNMVRGFILRIT